jgi:hypothetical protein
MAQDLFKPRGAQTPRSPTDTNQMNGRIYNPPRMAQLGGLSSTGKGMKKNSQNIRKPGDGSRVI